MSLTPTPDAIPLPERYRNKVLFRGEPIFRSPLRKPTPGEKVFSLTQEQVDEIRRIRSLRVELDPGMGGVAPTRIREWIEEGISVTSLDFMLTRKCNFKCTWCFAASHPAAQEFLPFDVLERTVQQACAIGTKLFILTGGEPLMYRDPRRRKGFFDVVDLIQDTYRAASREARILVFDDVALITPAIAAQIADRRLGLCTKGDTLDAELQDYKLQTRGAFDKMMRGYRNLWDAGYGARKELPIVVNTVLDATTFDGIVDLHFWVREHGMEHSIVPVHYCGNAIDETQEHGVHSPHVKVLYDLIARIDREYFNDVWTPWSPFPKNKTCNRNLSGLHVRANGLITACSEAPTEDPKETHPTAAYTFGNLNREDLASVAASQKLTLYRREFEEGVGEYVCNPDVCDLNRYDLCRGGCAVRSAYSVMDYTTGLISASSERHRYSQFREDPLCPAWTVLAEKQGVLREGLLDDIHAQLVSSSARLDRDRFRQRVAFHS